jgi:hypothetical protein
VPHEQSKGHEEGREEETRQEPVGEASRKKREESKSRVSLNSLPGTRRLSSYLQVGSPTPSSVLADQRSEKTW